MPSRFEVWKLEGDARSGGELSLLCCTRSRNRAYLADLVFGPGHTATCCGRAALADLPVLSREFAGECALLVAEGSREELEPERAASDFVLPCWLLTEVDLPCGPATLADPGVKSDLRRMRRAGLRYEVTHDPAALERFYRTMYLPFATRRHGDAACVAPYDLVLSAAAIGELLTVEQDGRPVGGTIILHEADAPRLWLAGILDGDPAHLANGVMAATNYFAFQHLAAAGHARVRLGYARPFLRDGVLQYKRKWHHRIASTAARERFLVRVLSPTPAAVGFLHAQPFVAERDGAFHATLFALDPDTPAVDPATSDAARERLPVAGLATVSVCRWGREGVLRRECVPLAGPTVVAASPRAVDARETPADRSDRYWRAQLADAPAFAALPWGAGMPVPPASRRRTVRCVMPSRLADAVRTLSVSEACASHDVLRAAFDLLVARILGVEDVLVVDGPVVGRTDLSGDPTVRQLLRRVRRQRAGAAMQGAPAIDRLRPWLTAREHAEASAVWPLFFTVTDAALDAACAAAVASAAGWRGDDRLDLGLVVRAAAGGALELCACYDPARLRGRRTAELLRQYAGLLEQFAADATRRVGSLSLVTARAARRLPDPRRDLRISWPGSVAEQFARQAADAPDRVAITDGRDVWTYGALHTQVDRLATHLRACGLRDGDVVAIDLPRSAALVWALLGVMQAGGRFLVLDRQYPVARLREYLARAAPAAMIVQRTGQAGAEQASLLADGHLLVCRVEADRSFDRAIPPSPSPPALLARETDPDSAAYVAFTSGSSGQPKAVLGAHRSLTQFVPWYVRTFGLTAHDRFSLLAGLSHDPLHRDVLLPLQIGATVCVPSEDDHAQPARLGRWLRREAVTVANLTPGLISLLANVRGRVTAPALRLALVVGDILTRRHVRELGLLFPAAACASLYGATETQQALGCFIVPHAWTRGASLDDASGGVPLGRGIDGVQLLVLRTDGTLAGVGERGEIGVRSRALAIEYLDDEPATAARFVAWGGERDEADRLYRTGDVGRYDADGSITFEGRGDRQVKILGHRVELAEIDAALAAHGELRDAVVLARADPFGMRQLVAYAVAVPQARVTESSLRAFLASRLPAYMVPSAIFLRRELPLTPNRKVDWQALERASLELDERRGHDVSEEIVREALIAIWADVLERPAVGTRDEFFELGGHSLAAMQIIVKARDRFGLDIPLETVFWDLTIEKMSETVWRMLQGRR